MSKSLVWSPYDREAYTVKLADGSVGGYGARKVFDDRPGLWNMYWLNSATLDDILTCTETDPDKVPGSNSSLEYVELSAYFLCGATTLEDLATECTPEEWVQHILDRDLHPPLRVFWDRLEGDSWEAFVTDRIPQSRHYTEREGNVIKVQF